MKKSLYFVVCFIVMFGYCGEVSAVVSECTNARCNDSEKKSASAPIANYINSCGGNKDGSSGCGGTTETSIIESISNDTIFVNRSSGLKYVSCNYQCYKKHKILIMLDDSNSFGDRKLENAKDIINIIIDNMNDSDLLSICYFSGACKFNGKWISGTQAKGKEIELNKKNYNTNFVSAYENVAAKFNESKTSSSDIPILFFLTDGYPTENNGITLGYMSSARYAFQAANRLENLIDSMKRGSYNTDNPYEKANARIITIGLGINSRDKFAQFILNPTSENKDALANDQNNEAITLKSILDNQSSSQIEAVANICSFPDKGGITRGILRASESITDNYKHKVDFIGLSKYASSDYLSKLSANDLCFTLGKGFSGNDLVLRCSTSSGYTCNGAVYSKTENGHKKGDRKTGFSDVPPDYFKVKASPSGGTIYVLDYDFFKNHTQATYRLVWKKNNSANDAGLTKYDFKGVDFNYRNVYKSYLGSASSIKSDLERDIKDILGWDTATVDEDFFEKQTVVTKIHSNCLGVNGSKTVTISGNFKIDGVGTVNSISVPIVITEDAKFDAGTLKNGINVGAGRGFAFTGSYVENNIYWYYSYFDNYSNSTPSDPIIYYNGSNKTTLPKLKRLNGSSYSIDDFDVLVWGKIREGIEESSSTTSNVVKTAFKTVASNDKDNNTSTMPLFVESDFSDCSSNKVVYNSNSTKSADAKKCVVKYIISQPKAYINRLTREFVYQQSTIDETYENNELYLSECSSGSSGCNSNKYYIPFDQPKIDDLPIYIKGNFSSVKGLELDFDNICNVSVDNGTMKTEPDQVKYRSIDINDPFPKAGNTYDKISSNWRDWYCGSGASNLCSVNGQNKARLSNSYSKIFYSISLNSDMIFEINKDTIENERYTQFVKGTNKDDGLPSGFSSNGVSEFVTSKFKTLASVNDNSFCSVGEFYEKCDQR